MTLIKQKLKKYYACCSDSYHSLFFLNLVAWLVAQCLVCWLTAIDHWKLYILPCHELEVPSDRYSRTFLSRFRTDHTTIRFKNWQNLFSHGHQVLNEQAFHVHLFTYGLGTSENFSETYIDFGYSEMNFSRPLTSSTDSKAGKNY